MDNMISILIPECINFCELLKSSKIFSEINCEGKTMKLLSEELTESEQKWYIANLYLGNNYNEKSDYPIRVRDIFHMLGYANKSNANRTIKGNFTKNVDYKIISKKNEKNEIREEFLLNIETFKELCMLVKSERGKMIRQYYIKLSNAMDKILKIEIETK